MKIEGMTEELAKAVAEASVKELNDYVPKSRITEVTEAKNNAEALVKERDKQLEELKKSTGNNEELKKQIEQLQADNKAAKEKYEADIKKMQIDNAVLSALKDAGALNTTAVQALLKDLDKAELAEDGTVKGLADQIQALQKSDSYLFKGKEEPSKPTGVTPAGGGSQTTPGAEGTWATKLAEARKNGNTSEAIAIKREAFATDGVVLI